MHRFFFKPGQYQSVTSFKVTLLFHFIQEDPQKIFITDKNAQRNGLSDTDILKYSAMTDTEK